MSGAVNQEKAEAQTQTSIAERESRTVPARRGAGSRHAPHAGWAGAREALHAEWTKLRTLPGTFWLLLGIAVLTVAVSAAATAAVTCADAHCGQDPAKVGLTGIEFGQAVVAVLAVLAMCGEYSTGMIRVTFAAMPHRTTVLAAKAALVSALTALAGTVAVLASLLIARLVMPGKGFTAAHGYPPLSLGDTSILRAAFGSVLYLALIALLSLGIAALVHDSAAAIGLVLGLLYLSPIIAQAVGDRHWHDRIERYSPMNAGLAVQATRNLGSQFIGPWEGLGVLALWAAAALLAGGLFLRLRDA